MTTTTGGENSSEPEGTPDADYTPSELAAELRYVTRQIHALEKYLAAVRSTP